MSDTKIKTIKNPITVYSENRNRAEEFNKIIAQEKPLSELQMCIYVEGGKLSILVNQELSEDIVKSWLGTAALNFKMPTAGNDNTILNPNFKPLK